MLLDGWVHFKAPARTAVIMKQVRMALESLLVAKIEHPSIPFGEMEGGDLVDVIVRLIATEKKGS